MNQMPDADGSVAIARACRQLHNIADINRSGVGACLDAFNDCPDAESVKLLSQSLAYAIAQERLLIAPMQLLALDAECANTAAMAKVEG